MSTKNYMISHGATKLKSDNTTDRKVSLSVMTSTTKNHVSSQHYELSNTNSTRPKNQECLPISPMTENKGDKINCERITNQVRENN